MNEEAVREIARHHKQLERLRAVSDDAGIEAVRREAEAAQARALWNRLARECKEYCDYYNAAIGNARVFCEVHDDAIVVRSHADPQNTVTLSRTPGPFHTAMVVAHRYRYPGRAADLPVGVRTATGDALTLTFDGRDMSPEDLVLTLLKTYTEELVTP